MVEGLVLDGVMSAKRAKRIEEFSNDDPIVDTGWLRDEITKLRRPIAYGAGAIVDAKTWAKWRIVVGMYQVDADGQPVYKDKEKKILAPTRQRYCTQRQAARLILLSLWKPAGRPFIKEILHSDRNTSQIASNNVGGFFNDWMDATEGVEAQPLLDKIIEKTGQLTGGQLSNMSESMTPGKRVPVGNLARLVDEPVGSNQPCSRAATRIIIQWLINRAQRMNRAIARSYSRRSQPRYSNQAQETSRYTIPSQRQS